jgi:hypothetical protein
VSLFLARPLGVFFFSWGSTYFRCVSALFLFACLFRCGGCGRQAVVNFGSWWREAHVAESEWAYLGCNMLVFVVLGLVREDTYESET